MHLKKKTYQCLDWVQQNFLCFLAPCWIGKAVKQEVHKNQFMCEWNIWMTVELTHGPNPCFLSARVGCQSMRWAPASFLSSACVCFDCLTELDGSERDIGLVDGRFHNSREKSMIWLENQYQLFSRIILACL